MSFVQMNTNTAGLEQEQPSPAEKTLVKLKVALGVTTAVALILGVALCVSVTSNSTSASSSDTPAGLSGLRAPVTQEQVVDTHRHFFVGEGFEDEKDQIHLTPHLNLTTDRLKRFHIKRSVVEGKDNLNQYITAGATHIYDKDGKLTHRQHIEVLQGGAATLGEFADRWGQVGPHTMRFCVHNEITGDKFYLVPIGLSMAWLNPDHNQTITPDLFFFSFQAAGSELKDRVTSFCTTAAHPSIDLGKCFLGRGQEEWDNHVLPWAGAYAQAAGMFDDKAGRRLLWGSRSTDERVGGAVGGYVGGKVGGAIGEKVGGSAGAWAGEAAGGAIGGAVAGPPGAVIGAEVGEWAGEKAGSYAGEKIGEHYGDDIGSDLGSDAGDWASGR